MQTFLVVPAETDQAGRMRVVCADGHVVGALRSYRSNPDAWREAGIVNSRGDLVCLDGPDCIRTDMRDAQPIAGGNVFLTR